LKKQGKEPVAKKENKNNHKFEFIIKYIRRRKPYFSSSARKKQGIKRSV